eukprot:78622_1
METVQWLSISGVGLLATAISGRILYNELKKIKSGSVKFTTNWLFLWSFLCIACGPIVGLCIFLSPFNGFCYFTPTIQNIVNQNQSLFIGFYQLSRLFYCFSSQQAYSSKGYSNCLFIFMFTIGIILGINSFILPFISGYIPSHCGIADDYKFYVEFIDFGSLQLFNIWIGAWSFIYLCWDVCTLLLYALKIKTFRKFKSENIDIYKRILSILHRVLIITLFYEIMGILMYFVVFIAMNFVSEWYIFLYLFNTSWYMIVLSYSMSLMQAHNTCEYIKFLKFLCYFRLNYICCCYKHIVDEQLIIIASDNMAKDKHGENINDKSSGDTKYETGDLPEGPARIQQIGCELSIETTI